MTFNKLSEIIKKNNIPDDVLLLSDSGWECGSTKMDGIWYCKDKNVIVFTQGDCGNSAETQLRKESVADYFKDYERMKFIKLNDINSVILK